MKTNQSEFKNLVVLFLIGFIFASCSSDDDGINEPPEEGNNPPIILDCGFFSANPDVVLEDDPEAPIDYIITCMATVENKLTVEPGVVIAFEQDAGLNFRTESSFRMEGTAEKPILLTGTEKTKGFWSGIYTQSSNADNLLNYVTIDYAGGASLPSHGQEAALGVFGNNSPITINHCTIKNSNSKGMDITAASSIGQNEQKVFLTNSVFTQNNLPIKSDASRLRVYNGTNSFTGNEKDYVYLAGGNISGDAIWSKLDVPYLMKNTENYGFKIDHGTLTVEPGTDIMMTSQSSMRVYQEGALVMVGTEDEPIIVRGEEDVPGYWNQIRIYSANPLNEIGHVNIRNAGQTTGNPKGAVWLEYSDFLNIHDVVFSDCFEYGVSLDYKPAMPLFHLEYDNLTLDGTPKLFSDFNGVEVEDPHNP